MRALVYGGAFNPPTAAHIALAEFACQKTGSDCVIFVPTKMTYIRDDQGKDFAFGNEKRLQMLETIAEKREWMKVSDYELKAEEQPRTYVTLCHLRSLGYECRLLFGSDKLTELEHGWKYMDEIFDEFGVVCMQRSNDDCAKIIAADPYLSAHSDRIELIDTPDTYQNYSSSRIRELLKSGQPDTEELKRLLPEELYGLIPERGEL